jgi:hypothetical protein
MNSSASSSASDPDPNSTVGLVSQGITGIDLNGVWLLVATLGAVALYLIFCLLIKWSRTRGKMSTADAARVRLAAARGQVDILEWLKREVPYFEPNASTGGFTALHAACCSGQPGNSTKIHLMKF